MIYHNDNCHVLFILKLNAILLSVIMLNIVAPVCGDFILTILVSYAIWQEISYNLHFECLLDS
jgi:hypothetical protein